LTTGIIWAQVWKFERFGACFRTCALIIWSVLLQAMASRAVMLRARQVKSGWCVARSNGVVPDATMRLLRAPGALMLL
jgi:hypothetical protein